MATSGGGAVAARQAGCAPHANHLERCDPRTANRECKDRGDPRQPIGVAASAGVARRRTTRSSSLPRATENEGYGPTCIVERGARRRESHTGRARATSAAAHRAAARTARRTHRVVGRCPSLVAGRVRRTDAGAHHAAPGERAGTALARGGGHPARHRTAADARECGGRHHRRMDGGLGRGLPHSAADGGGDAGRGAAGGVSGRRRHADASTRRWRARPGARGMGRDHTGRRRGGGCSSSRVVRRCAARRGHVVDTTPDDPRRCRW